MPSRRRERPAPQEAPQEESDLTFRRAQEDLAEAVRRLSEGFGEMGPSAAAGAEVLSRINTAIQMLGGCLYLSLHTAEPDSQSDHEIAYPEYHRVAVPRTASHFRVGQGQVELVQSVDFPECGGEASGVVSHVGVGTARVGEGTLLGVSQLRRPVDLDGVVFRLEAGSTILTGLGVEHLAPPRLSCVHGTPEMGCEDEGCPQYGTPHVHVDSVPQPRRPIIRGTRIRRLRRDD